MAELNAEVQIQDPTLRKVEASELSDQGLALKVAQILVAEISNGASLLVDTTREMRPTEALKKGIEWLLSDKAPRSFGVKLFALNDDPGSQQHEKGTKNAFLEEFAERLVKKRNPSDG